MTDARVISQHPQNWKGDKLTKHGTCSIAYAVCKLCKLWISSGPLLLQMIHYALRSVTRVCSSHSTCYMRCKVHPDSNFLKVHSLHCRYPSLRIISKFPNSHAFNELHSLFIAVTTDVISEVLHLVNCSFLMEFTRSATSTCPTWNMLHWENKNIH